MLGYTHTTERTLVGACGSAGHSADSVGNRRLRRHGLQIGPILTALAAPLLQCCLHVGVTVTYTFAIAIEENEEVRDGI